MNDINMRGSLTRFKQAIGKGKLKVGFAGGSITTADNRNNWPTYVRGWLVDRFKNVRLTVVNAGIGATGSLTGLALCQKEFIDSGCDVVFVEYAVNDNDVDKQQRMRTREGLIRKLLKAGIDVVIVYTFCQGMYEQAMKGETPHSIADFETLAEHYHISSVYMANAALDTVKRGMMPYHMWLPDGIHPQNAGSTIYAQKVIEFLEQELSADNPQRILRGEEMPSPIDAGHWQNAYEIAFADMQWFGSWSVEREPNLPWFDQRLYTYGINDRLAFDFEGRALAIIFNYGKTTGLLTYRIDGGEWQEYAFPRYWWLPEENFTNAVIFADDLENKTHSFELKVTHGNQEGFTSSDCKIYKVLAVR